MEDRTITDIIFDMTDSLRVCILAWSKFPGKKLRFYLGIDKSIDNCCHRYPSMSRDLCIKKIADTNISILESIECPIALKTKCEKEYLEARGKLVSLILELREKINS